MSNIPHQRPDFAIGDCYSVKMFTSIAGVFRTRQVMADLMAYVSLSGRDAFCRIVSLDQSDAGERLDRVLNNRGGCFSLPADETLHGEVLLAAALPDEDFPAFTCSTALLLLDRLRGGDGDDDLYWNWDAFFDQYRMADPSVRAVLMNGFRLAAELGRASISHLPDPIDCLTRRPEDVLLMLDGSNSERIAAAIETGVGASEAGTLWCDIASGPSTAPMLAGIRYLYERSASIAPKDPHAAPLIPWTL